MIGTLASIASLTICLGMTNAFVVRVPKTTPPAGSAWTKQASESVGSPLLDDGRSLGAGGTLSRIGDNDVAESSGQRLPWMPFGRGYGASCRHSTCLHVTKGVQPEITQDGNVTVPIVGGAGSEERESTNPDIIQDGNATVPIVGGVGEEGRDSGVAAESQDDEGAVQHGVAVMMEELASHESFFGPQESVMVIASAAHESASTTQEDDDDSPQGVSDNAILTDAILTTDSDFATCAAIATDAEVPTTDANLQRENQEQLSRGASSDNIKDEAPETANDDTTLGEEVSFELTADGGGAEASLTVEGAVGVAMESEVDCTEDSASGEEMPFELTADGVASEASLTVEDAVGGTMESVPHGIDDRAIHEEMSFDVADNDFIDTTSSKRLDPDGPDNAAHDDVGSVPDNPDNGFYDLMGTAEDDDDISDKAIPRTVLFGGDMDDLVWSLLQDALARGLLDSRHLILDPILDHLMWSKLYDAISGRGESELALALYNVKTSLLHDAFFGPTASKAVAALAKKADDSVLVVNDYANAVADLYAKFKRVRDRAATGQAPTDVVRSDLIDQMNVWLFGPEFADYAVDLKMACVLHFNEEHRFNPAAANLIDEKRIRPFDPGMAGRAAADASTPKLYEDTSDGAATADAVFYNDPVNDLVFAVVCDTLAKGSKGLMMLNPVMDKLMRSMLHEALTGRAAVESESLADALDEMVTCLLHDAFFGPKAFKTVAKIAKSADNSKLVVDQYIESVIAQYAKFKEARGSSPDSETPAVRKAGKGAKGWLKKLWRRIRRKKH